VTRVSQQESIHGEPDCTTDVELALRADPTHLPIVRSMAATIAIREDFDMDAVEDIKLAVDEACSTLILRARPGDKLRCRFQVAGGVLSLLATAATDGDQPLDQRSFGWRVLATLTDDVHTWITSDASEGHRVHIEMTKARGTAVAG
jgi:serine/threonine-protein kinase RsbW